MKPPCEQGGTACDASLLPQHARLLSESGISAEVANARGYRSVTKKSELLALGFGKSQALVPALLIPIWGVSNKVVLYQSRPDTPRIGKGGKPIKYETPGGSRMAIDIPPCVRPGLHDPRIPLLITEGIRKADAAASIGLTCIALLGVWNWRGTNEVGGKMALPDWESIPLNGRKVYIAFDSDVTVKASVHEALSRLKAFLESRNADVEVIYLPPGANGEKVGLDDYLAAGHPKEELLALAQPLIVPVDRDDESPRVPYQVSPSGLFWMRPVVHGSVPVQLTNFTAHILSDITEDDGVEKRRLFEIEARLNGRTVRLFILSAQFANMNWAAEHLGAGAIIFPGSSLRDHARAAVQMLSPSICEKQVYSHLGWSRAGNLWIYLHAGGAIGSEGTVPGVQVSPPESLRLFSLPDPPTGEALRSALRASLRLLKVAPLQLTVPVFAAVYRAVLGGCDFSLHISGLSGEGKTAMASLAQQHYGSGLDADHTPGSWLSTANATEGLAFAAKDALLLVDDFAPTGSLADVQRFHREADRVFRAQGNRSGRQRMRADATLRPPKPPRGLILSTGEDVPRGVSLRARLMILEHQAGSLDWKRLSECQVDAANGLYAQALAGFIHWLCPRKEQLERELPGRICALREKATTSSQHRRTPTIVASLAIGLQMVLQFAIEAGAVTAKEADDHWKAWWEALGQAAADQAQHHSASEPTTRFLQTLAGAIASGRAHVAASDGSAPETPEAWGWRATGVDGPNEDWKPLGDRVGWVVGQDLYLEPEAGFTVAQRAAGQGGDAISVTSRTLHKRLRDRGLLQSTDATRSTLTIRKNLGGARREVLHIHAACLIRTRPDQTDQANRETAAEHDDPWSGPWSGSESSDPKPDHQTDQEIPRRVEPRTLGGQFGQVVQTEERADSEAGGGSPEEAV